MPDSTSDTAAERLAAIVECSDDAIISKDLNGIVASWNRAAERIFGYSAAEMVGQSIRRIIPPELQSDEDEVLAKLRRGERVDHYETVRCRKDGTRLPVSLTISPVRNAAGKIIGASKIARDISDRKHLEEARAQLLAAIQDQAVVTAKLNEVGSVVASTLDRDTIVRTVTDAAADMTGAEFAAFYYNAENTDGGESYTVYQVSDASKEAFTGFPNPETNSVFTPTFLGRSQRIADITADPRHSADAPYFGMPGGPLRVRSYLAVPVHSRSGQVAGGLFFGHSGIDVFTGQHERLVAGIAAWASVGLENARLYVRAQEASRLRDEFLATLSHELRTPLNAIVGYTRMMRSRLLPAERQARAVETIERNATALTQIVEDVLDVARIISGKIRLNVQPVDVPHLVQEALDTVRLAADAKGITLAATLDPRAGPVSGDAERLQQVLWNLLSNAVKFTGRGGRVETRVAPANSHVEIAVSDTGVGIPPEFMPHVFERFRQADASMTRERGGLGLGLAITRHLVELHGGTIEVSSAGIGKGTTFRVRLPLLVRQTAAAAEPAGAFENDPDSAAPAVPDLKGVRVLAVDDDRDALALVREILEATGAQVTTVDSGAAALAEIERAAPDVLVADLGMPRMNGFELIGSVRRAEREELRAMPAAALTAYARSEDRARALRSGFQLHLSKPIDPGELMAAIAALARRRKAS